MIDQKQRKRAEGLALGGLLVALVGTLVMRYIAHYQHSIAAGVEAEHLLAAVLVWGICLLHLRARRLARDEQLYLEEAERQRLQQGRAKLFEGDELQSSIAQSRLREMERYGAPLAALLIILYQGIFGGLYLSSLWTLQGDSTASNIMGLDGTAELTQAALCASLALAVAFVCFAIGKYAAGLSRNEDLFLLRAGAGYMISCSIVCALLTLSYLFGYKGWLHGEIALRWLTSALLICLAIEMLINFVLDFYRPRLPGKESRPVYESRLTNLLAEPRGLFDTFAHTLDYQFGFRVSETWFFRFLNKAIAPLILFQLTTLYLLTGILVVQPGEVAVIERWGMPRGIAKLPAPHEDAPWDALEPPLEPGLHIKWPWPIETVHRIPRDQVQQIYIGAPQTHDADATAASDPFAGNVISWDKEHTEGEYRYIMPITDSTDLGLPAEAKEAAKIPDAMFVSGAITIQYAIGRPQGDGTVRAGDVYRYLYRYQDPERLMVAIGEREITSYMAGANFWNVLINKHAETEAELTRRMQDAVDAAGLGIRVLFVTLSNVHPPVGEVGKAYQQVVSSHEEMETKIYDAQATAAQKREEQYGEAAKLKNQARGYAAQRALVAAARAKRFALQLSAHNAGPDIYLHRERMAALEEALAAVKRITVVPSGTVAIIDDKTNATAGAVGKALLEEVETEQ